MASEHSPSTAFGSIDFTISEEELAWLAELGDGRPPLERPHSVHAGSVAGSVINEHVHSWAQVQGASPFSAEIFTKEPF